MPTTCVVVGCRSGHHPTKAEKDEIEIKETADREIVRRESILVHVFPVQEEGTFIKWKAALSLMHITLHT